VKVRFQSELRVAKGSSSLWRVLAPFKARLFFDEGDDAPPAVLDRQKLTVPAGFKTDFASVPRLPIAYLVAGDVCHRAPLLHDFLYRQGQIPRAWCDRIFLEAMVAEGVSWWRRRAMYAAVRAAGGAAYQGKE
jgi:uncharacterized protein DUF1353